jgi:hypothetical protein
MINIKPNTFVFLMAASLTDDSSEFLLTLDHRSEIPCS